MDGEVSAIPKINDCKSMTPVCAPTAKPFVALVAVHIFDATDSPRLLRPVNMGNGELLYVVPVGVHDIATEFKQVIPGMIDAAVVVSMIEIEFANSQKLPGGVIFVTTLIPLEALPELEMLKLRYGIVGVKVVNPQVVIALYNVPFFASNRVKFLIDNAQPEITLRNLRRNSRDHELKRKVPLTRMCLAPRIYRFPFTYVTEVYELGWPYNVDRSEYTFERRPVVHREVLVWYNQRTLYRLLTQIVPFVFVSQLQGP